MNSGTSFLNKDIIKTVKGEMKEINENLGRDAPAFGYQLLLDLYDCAKGVCDDLTLCYEFLAKMPGFIAMEVQSPPGIIRTDEVRYPDKAGLSGWVPLVESSIVIHTITPKNFISIDVYSCKRFDVEKVKLFCKKYFQPKIVEAQFVKRGLSYFKEEELIPVKQWA